MGEKIQGIRINGRYKIDREEVKNNSIGNVEAKELLCTTHGHELRWGVGNVGWGSVQDREE